MKRVLWCFHLTTGDGVRFPDYRRYGPDNYTYMMVRLQKVISSERIQSRVPGLHVEYLHRKEEEEECEEPFLMPTALERMVFSGWVAMQTMVNVMHYLYRKQQGYGS